MRSVRLTWMWAVMALVFTCTAYAEQRIVTFSSDIPRAERLSAVTKAGGKIVRELPVINAVAAVFQNTKSDRDLRNNMSGAVRIDADPYIKWIEAAPKYLSDIKLPSVESVMAGAKANTTAPQVPAASDPTTQPDPEIPWGVARVNATAAWNNGTLGAGVKVSIVDTGVDLDHGELADRIAGGYNAVDPAKTPDDDNGHGTHVAGTIAAKKDSNGVVGIAHATSLYAVKVLDAGGGGTYSNVIAGIEWCITNKMDVVNMSLGAPSGNAAMEAVMKAAYNAGVTIICAAGNSGGSVGYPAAYPQAIAISASDSKDAIAYFSSRGPQIAFIAPGVDINSSYKGGGYKTASGTSMACPHATGLAALAVSLGSKGPDAIRKALQNAAVLLPKLTKNEQGFGMIDAGKITAPKADAPWN